MNFEIRHIELNDWITITLFACVILLAVAKWFSSTSLTDLLSTYVQDRFIKVTRSNDDSSSLLIVISIIVYIINLSLLIYLWFQSKASEPKELIGFILTLTLLSTFLLVKHYIGKLMANLCNFEEILLVTDHHRNIYRAMFSYALLISNAVVIYGFKMSQVSMMTSLIIIVLVVFTYNLIIIYTYRKLLLSTGFYFILYLCTLEIAPYLLLYKYIML